MVKVFVLCAILFSVSDISESKAFSLREESLGKGAVDVSETYKRIKRQGRAPEVLNSVTGLVTGILDSTFTGVANVKRSNRPPGPTLIIGPGNNNENRVMLNGGGWDAQQGSSGWKEPTSWEPSSGGWGQSSSGGGSQQDNDVGGQASSGDWGQTNGNDWGQPSSGGWSQTSSSHGNQPTNDDWGQSSNDGWSQSSSGDRDQSSNGGWGQSSSDSWGQSSSSGRGQSGNNDWDQSGTGGWGNDWGQPSSGGWNQPIGGGWTEPDGFDYRYGNYRS